jgi:hypothetical protein
MLSTWTAKPLLTIEYGETAQAPTTLGPNTNDIVPLYIPSKHGEIRLLSVLSHDGEAASCQLHTYLLEQLPEYDAVSYCWGEGPQTLVATNPTW